MARLDHLAIPVADYVVSTDSEDWSEDVSLHLFDGTSAYVSPLPATR